MPQISGRSIAVQVIMAAASTSKVDGAYAAPSTGWVTLGGTRGLDTTTEWDTVDGTSRSSAGNVRESIATYLTVGATINGVWLTETAENIEEMNDYVNSPTTGQPYGWLKLTEPGPAAGDTITRVYYGLFTSFSASAPYDDLKTFDMGFNGLQPVIKTLVEAP